MKNSNVIALPASSSYTPEQALRSALMKLDDDGLADVLILGYDNNGELFIRSSNMSRADALWITEQAKQWCLYGGAE